MGSVKPLDEQFLKERQAEGYTTWISLEEHHTAGGLGSTLLEWMSENNCEDIKLKRMGIDDHFIHRLGPQQYVRNSENLTERSITKVVKTL